MKISIIIPAYNEEKLIGRCLQSILAAEIPFEHEIIVINNASTDNTKKIAQKFKGVKVIDEPKKGLTKAKQAGYENAKGGILVFFDADTIVPKSWFKTAVSIYEKDKRIVGISGPYIYEDIKWFEKLIYYDLFSLLFEVLNFQKGYLLGGNFSVKKEIIKKIGGFDTNINFYGEDTNLTRRIAEYGKIKFTRKLAITSSARRLKGEGRIKTVIVYVLNYFSEIIFKKPLHKEYKDVR